MLCHRFQLEVDLLDEGFYSHMAATFEMQQDRKVDWEYGTLSIQACSYEDAAPSHGSSDLRILNFTAPRSGTFLPASQGSTVGYKQHWKKLASSSSNSGRRPGMGMSEALGNLEKEPRCL